MMHLKQFQKLSKFLCFTLFFCYYSNLHSQSVKKDNINIIEIALKKNNNSTIERILCYLVINDNVYTGVVLTGNFGNYLDNKISKEFEDMIYNSLWAKWEENKCRNKTVFSPLKEISTENNSFFWRCFEISAEYVIVPMKIENNDFFCFFYDKNKSVVGFKDMTFKKIKKCRELPPVFIEGIKENKICW